MAWSILFIAVLIFAFRGYFLALPGVIGRCLGLILAYLVAYQYHQLVADWLSTLVNSPIPPLAFKIIAGSGLFFITLIATSLLIKLACHGLIKLIPFLSPLLDKTALTSRVAGAAGNSAIAVALVLIGLWGYGLINKPQAPDALQQVADQFGHALFSNAVNSLNISHFFSTTITSHQSSGNGSAVIQSDSKTLRIESQPQSNFHDIQLPDVNLQQLGELMQDEQLQQKLQAAMQDEELMRKAQEYIKENPQALQEALDSPELQQMIEQFKQQQ
jgi:hypothetical protein